MIYFVYLFPLLIIGLIILLHLITLSSVKDMNKEFGSSKDLEEAAIKSFLTFIKPTNKHK